MTKYRFWFCIVILACVTSAIAIYYSQKPKSDSVKPAPSHFPYSISADEKADLERRSTSGECDASTRLAIYNLYGTLDLDTATKYLRLAAKCPDIAPKEYLAQILIHRTDRAVVSSEIKGLVEDIRKTNPAKAADLEEELKATEQSKAP